MSSNIRELFDSLHHEHQVKEKYRYEALRAQINPHFIFNTLNSIRWMAIIRKADNIVESIDALANMLKYSMNKGYELVKLRDELENIKSYIFIQNTRYGDRYQVEIDVDEALYDYKIIKFILQPIVENAIIHAFKNSDGKGIVKIYGDLEEDTLKLYVEDNGNGVNKKEIEKFNNAKRKKGNDVKKVTGIGLTNVNERISIEYGDKYGIEILIGQPRGTIIVYTLPILTDGGATTQNEKNNDC
jgi:two-component system sensor histidine kinase YesM